MTTPLKMSSAMRKSRSVLLTTCRYAAMVDTPNSAASMRMVSALAPTRSAIRVPARVQRPHH